MDMDFRDFENGMKLVKEFVSNTQSMDFNMFMATVSMIIEERCKIENADMVNVCEKIWVAAMFMNEKDESEGDC